MAEHNLQLNFYPAIDNCFGDTPIVSKWIDGVPHGTLTIVVHNTGTEDINVVLDFGLGDHPETGWFKPNETRQIDKKLPVISGAGSIPCKLTRWRPGFLGQPGNGGGEIEFGMPFQASQATIELNAPK